MIAIPFCEPSKNIRSEREKYTSRAMFFYCEALRTLCCVFEGAENDLVAATGEDDEGRSE